MTLCQVNHYTRLIYCHQHKYQSSLFNLESFRFLSGTRYDSFDYAKQHSLSLFRAVRQERSHRPVFLSYSFDKVSDFYSEVFFLFVTSCNRDSVRDKQPLADKFGFFLFTKRDADLVSDRRSWRVVGMSMCACRGSEEMGSVWKRLQRVNKLAVKFQFTVSYHQLAFEFSPKW